MAIEILPEDIYSWQVNLKLDLAPTATIELNNKSRRYDVDEMIGQIVSITALANLTDPYDEWFRGKILGHDPTFAIGGKYNIALQCVSFFNRLDRKPVNTERYGDSPPWDNGGIPSDELLNELLGTFGCYDPSLYDFASVGSFPTGVQTFFSRIAISESSLADAVRKIAMACQQELFVDRHGVLRTSPYQTEATELDEEILFAHIKSVAVQKTHDDAFSRVRVRARYLDYGEKYGIGLLYDGDLSFKYNSLLGDANQKGQLNLGSVPREELLNAIVISDDPRVLGIVIEAVSGGTVYFQFSVVGTLAMVGTHSFHIIINTSGITNNEAHSIGNSMHNVIKSKAATVVKKTYNEMTTPRAGNSPIYRSIKPVDEKEENRIEAYREDVELMDKIGVLWEEVDNPYISDYLTAVAVADRRFIEAKYARNKWTVEMAYDRNMDLNKKVSFSVLEKSPFTYITGICRELTISYSANDPSLKMTLVADQMIPSETVVINLWEESHWNNATEDEWNKLMLG